MEQINIRVKTEEKRLIKEIAEIEGISVTEFSRRAVLSRIGDIRVDLAFKLLKEGKIGRKRAWTLSGLSNMEFLSEWTARGAEEKIADDLIDKELDVMKSLEIKKYLLPHSRD